MLSSTSKGRTSPITTTILLSKSTLYDATPVLFVTQKQLQNHCELWHKQIIVRKMIIIYFYFFKYKHARSWKKIQKFTHRPRKNIHVFICVYQIMICLEFVFKSLTYLLSLRHVSQLFWHSHGSAWKPLALPSA